MVDKKQSYIERINQRTNSRVGSVDSYISTKPTDRKAKCMSCGLVSSSDKDLPFWEKSEEKPNDWYYCGCEGWD